MEKEEIDYGKVLGKTIKAAKSAMRRKFGRSEYYDMHPEWLHFEGDNERRDVIVEYTVHDCGTCFAVNGSAMVLIPETLPTSTEYEMAKEFARKLFYAEKAIKSNPWAGKYGTADFRKAFDATRYSMTILKKWE